MMRVLVWKEVREQRAIWATLALASVGCALVIRQLLPNSLYGEETLVILLCMMAWLYGVFCGSLLFAGETEEGTQLFLDALPADRRLLWTTKAITGLALVAAQMIFLIGVGFVFLQTRMNSAEQLVRVAVLLFFGSSGYIWGLFCGAFTSRVLVAFGWAVLFQIGAGCIIVAFVILQMLINGALHLEGFYGASFTEHYSRMAMLFLALSGLSAALMAVGSRQMYCRVDRMRQSTTGRTTSAISRNLGVLFWLGWLQFRRLGGRMAVFGLVAGLVVVEFGPMVWVPLTLFAGILCGITVFAGEHRWNAERFLGEQRLPLWCFWLVKVGLALSIGLVAVILALAVAVAMAWLMWSTALQPEKPTLEQELLYRIGSSALLIQPTVFVPLGLLYGYAVGLLFGVIFRKPLVSAAIASAIAIGILGLWTPSLVSGGLHGWQIWGVPAIFLVATRFLMKPWVAGGLWSVRGVCLTAAFFFAAGLWLAAAIWYRAYEIPIAPDTVDVKAFEAGMPTLEQNAGGRLAAAAMHHLEEKKYHAFSVTALGVSTRSLKAEHKGDSKPSEPINFYAEAAKAPTLGWAAADPQLGPWLDLVFRDAWVGELREAADMPVGMIVDPRDLTFFSRISQVSYAPYAVQLLIARSLQQQAYGDPAAFVDNLRVALALVWNMRYHTGAISVMSSRRVELVVLDGLSRWLEQLYARPDLLRRTLGVLQRHEAMPQPDAEDIRQAEFLFLLNSFNDPQVILKEFHSREPSSLIRKEAEFLRIVWQVPWEKIRLHRLLNAFVSRDDKLARRAWEATPPLFDWARRAAWGYDAQWNEHQNTRALCQVRGALLQVALRLYQAEQAKPADKLADLVPTYLPVIPADPFDGRPFRYRLSRGEILSWPTGDPVHAAPADASPETPGRQRLRIPAGQGILWSVDEDGKDNGGRIQEMPHAKLKSAGEDIIFLVPLPPK